MCSVATIGSSGWTGGPHPSPNAEYLWEGFSTGKVNGNRLTITTTHMKYGVIQRNGVPASTRATMTEHFIRHGDRLTLMTIVDDPVYLEEPFVRTSHWVRSSNITVDQRWLFEVVDEVAGRSIGYVPHYPWGTKQDGYREEARPSVRGDAGRQGHHLPGVRAEAQRDARDPASGAFVNALKRATMRLAVLVATLACSVYLLDSHAQQPVATVPLTPPPPPLIVDGLEVLPVQGNVHMIVGAGANIGVQIGEEGAFVVDSGGAGNGEKLMAALSRLTNRPVRFLVNTNADADHIAGNELVVKSQHGTRGPRPGGGGGGAGQNVGVVSVAHENAFNRMSEGSRSLPPLTGDGLPASTFFTPRKDLFSNGEPVQLISQPSAHTDGDILVFFRKSDVIATGDVFVTTSYPVIDASRGGSVQGVLDALNAIIELTVPERNQMGGTRVIPGHGRICNEADVVEYRDMVTIVRDRVQEMAKKGMTLQQVKAARPSLEYDGIYGATTGEWTTDMFLETMYREVSKGK